MNFPENITSRLDIDSRTAIFVSIIHQSLIIMEDQILKARAQRIKDRISQQPTEYLQASALLLQQSESEGAGLSFKLVLDELERRLPENEYLSFELALSK